MKKKKIYIHIGTPKTGTSSIQKFLTKNVNILLEKGVFYPIVGRWRPASEAIEPKDYESLDFCMNGGVLHDEASFNQVLERFDKSQATSMLLSEECLFLEFGDKSFCNKEYIWEQLSSYEVKIIVYFRRSLDYLCSFWQEHIKCRSQVELIDFLENKDYLKHLENFHTLSCRVGEENIIVKPFEKDCWKNNDLIEDFLATFGIKNSGGFKSTNSFENFGFSRVRCEKILYVNKHLGMEETDRDHYNVNQRVPFKENECSVIDSLSDDVIRKFTEKYFQEECKIARKFLNKETLFSLKYPKIYGVKREEYKSKISKEEREELALIITSTLQRRIIDGQSKLVDLMCQHNQENRDNFSVEREECSSIKRSIWKTLERIKNFLN